MSLFAPQRRIAVSGRTKHGREQLVSISVKALERCIKNRGERVLTIKKRRTGASVYCLESGTKVSYTILGGPDVPGLTGLLVQVLFKGPTAVALAKDYAVQCTSPNTYVRGPA